MDTMVNKLLDVDKQAKQVVDDARQYRERILLELEREKRDIRQSLEDKARIHIENAKKSYTLEADDEILDIKVRYQALAEGLEKTFEGGHTEWEGKLYDRCVR